MICLLKEKATKEQINQMLMVLKDYIKLAVDIDREIIAGGGAMHADCERILLEDGSYQENIWGADWDPSSQAITFEALINIRPRQNNMSMEIQDEDIKYKIKQIVIKILGNV